MFNYRSFFWCPHIFVPVAYLFVPAGADKKKKQRNRMQLSDILTFSKHESELIAQHVFYD